MVFMYIFFYPSLCVSAAQVALAKGRISFVMNQWKSIAFRWSQASCAASPTDVSTKYNTKQNEINGSRYNDTEYGDKTKIPPPIT